MKTVGLFEAKTKLSEICEEVARTREPVTVTRRGRPLVRIEPEEATALTIRERRADYVTRHKHKEKRDARDFEAPPRSRETMDFTVP